MKRTLVFAFVTAAVLTTAPVRALPAPQQVLPDDEWCRNDNWGGDRAGYCEVRQYVLGAGAGVMQVDAAPNGGIQVDGSARRDIVVKAKVVAQAATTERAHEIVNGVRVDAAPDKVGADGPAGLADRESWSVSYRVEVPTLTSLSLKTTNGGIKIADVEGQIEFQTVNGGVKLSGLAGTVKGRTNNGGVDIELEGASWRGEGLDVQTNNGGVKLSIPEQYSAHLETSTVNGGMNSDIPITMQGQIAGPNRPRDISVDLGAGGPPIRVRTHNGGVRILKKHM
jgi:putative adhesin